MKGLGKPLNLLRAALALVGLGSLREVAQASAVSRRSPFRSSASASKEGKRERDGRYHKIGNHRYRKSRFNEMLLGSMRRSAEMPQRRFHKLSAKKAVAR